jgi:uncharacterized protein YbcC (UPF0753/DUF2309 family)
MSNQTFAQVLSQVRTRLPIQNPLHTYVHNNILLMFENKDFHEALSEAQSLYRATAYWPLHRYQNMYTEGKITDDDIHRAVDHYLGRYHDFSFLSAMDLPAKEFFYRLIHSDLAFNDDDSQPKITDEHLWGLCKEKTQGASLVLSRSPVKWRAKDYWEKYHNENTALSTQPFIIRLISSFLDQGQGFWSNPFAESGFWSFFSYDLNSTKGYMSGWQKVLAAKVSAYGTMETEEIIQTELRRMGIPEEQWTNFILELLFDLKGWAGMVNKLELEPWQATVKAPKIKLVDYIAALVLMESSLDDYHAKLHSLDLSVLRGRTEKIEMKSYQLALALYQITTSFKLQERWMQRLTTEEIVSIIDQIDEADHVHKIRLWHESYEHHFYKDALSAIVGHTEIPAPTKAPYASVLFCVDDREESIRRQVEEADPELVTFGVVGFFGIDMKFAGLKNDRLIAQCPPVISPSKIVKEVPKTSEDARLFERFNKFSGGGGLSLYYQSRTLFRGFFATLIFGTASIIPMFLQVFFPAAATRLRKKTRNLITPEPKTYISIDKTDHTHGYSKEEMSNIVGGILPMCGVKPPYSSLIVMMGHGASSTNNPFKQAYGCGACGGNAGVPNSRAFAKMANDPEVRTILREKGIDLPETTVFVSGYHDTTSDEITFFETEDIPASHLEHFFRLRTSVNKARRLNAFERCQRFSSFKPGGTPDDALKHVKDRAEDLAQPRPEYGHCRTALAIVGKRDFTKGLFLNRRPFLISYDWEIDPEGKLLFQAVIGAVPVSVNINMDYYFSCVDNENFGCGSKLPLNLTSLLGVMTGSQSDLRIGLARQMVEIHEPIRSMTVLKAPLERVLQVFNSHPRLKNILYNHWTRVVVFDPQLKQWFIFGQTEFAPLDTEKLGLKHFTSSKALIDQVNTTHDFAEIDS